MLNTVTFVGNLAADPELRFTTSGKAVTEIRVIVNRRTKDAKGEYVDAEPTGYSCTIWGSAAENVAESVARGDRVLVVGHVETETWTDRETKAKRTRETVVVEEIGTSLTWATARPTKTTRTSTDSAPAEEGAPF